MCPHTETSSQCFVRPTAPSTATSAIICHISASRSDQPNAFGDKIPVPTALNVHMWAHLLHHYDDKIVAEFFFPPDCSVNSGIPLHTYLDSPFNLSFPGMERLCELILSKGRGCLVYKKDLQRVYRQISIDPTDYHLLGFNFDNQFYFATCCPFGLRTSAMICQRTTKAVIYIFTQSGFPPMFI